MKKNVLRTNLWREIKKTKARFLSILAISALSVAFFAGIRATSPDMELTADLYFDSYRLADLTVVSTSGITQEDLNTLASIEGVASVQGNLSVDAMMHYGDNQANIHLISMPMQEQPDLWTDHPSSLNLLPSYEIDTERTSYHNMPELIEGRLPQTSGECAFDEAYANTNGIELGDTYTFTTNTGSVDLMVCGIIRSPAYISFDRGSSTIGNGESDAFVYASGEDIMALRPRLPLAASLVAVYTDASITVEGAEELNCFEDDYIDLVRKVQKRIEATYESQDQTVYVLNRSSYSSYSDYSENVQRIDKIGNVFPIIFFLVAILVSLTTMTRMVEEQRTQIGSLKALGYSRRAIIFEYIAYAALASLSGGVIGVLIGFKLFPSVIYSVYGILYALPPLQTQFLTGLAIGSIAVAMLSVVLAAYLACRNSLKAVPATLLRPKAPKVGKRIFLERTFLWKHFSFTKKVTARNLFRYKKRFFMSIIGIAGSCALLVTGFGLQDSIMGILDQQFEQIWHFDMKGYMVSSVSLTDMENIISQTMSGENVQKAIAAQEQTYDMYKAGNEDTTVNAYLTGTNDPAALKEMVIINDANTGEDLPLTDDGVVVTQKLARMLELEVGDEIVIESGSSSYPATVTGIARNFVQHYVYLSDVAYEKIFGKPMEYNAVFGFLNDNSEEAHNALSSALIQDGRISTIVYLSSLGEDIQESLSKINSIVYVLIISAAALAFVVMYNLTNINITEREREIATLKVLGFTPKETYQYIFKENRLLSIIGTLVGLVLGIFLHKFVIGTAEVDMVMFLQTVNLPSFVYSAVLTLLFSAFVNLVMRRKIRSIDMVESLKSIE